MWNLLEDVTLFERPAGEDGEYDAHVHLAQMVSLLGEPPEEVIKRERVYREHQLRTPVMNPRNKECKTMNEFWGGPFFDNDSESHNHVLGSLKYTRRKNLRALLPQIKLCARTCLREGRSWQIQ